LGRLCADKCRSGVEIPENRLDGDCNGVRVMPGMQFNSGNHTKRLVPLWAKGDAGRLFRSYANLVDPVRGKYINNTNIAEVMFSTLGK
jgi:alkaline phosphatase